jgi:23S rRNA (adenine-N6)-dimethyltransferase
VGAHSRSSRAGRPSDDQHFLRSSLIAAELVRDARISPEDHVVEIGAGRGRLTRPLAETAGRVTAVEIDPILAERLRHEFAPLPHVEVVVGDILRTPLPAERWRAFGNIPFSLTTAILRRLLDDPVGGLERVDLLMQFEAARKRAAVYPSTLLNLSWAPWWELELARRLPRLGFEPPPSVDAGLLVVRPRRPWLLHPRERRAYVALLRRAFDRGSWPVRRSLAGRVPPVAWKRFARDRGISNDARPTELGAWDWVALFVVASRHR